jgi:hypothetical protein
VANAVADGLSNTVAANASVQAKDPVVVTQPQPLVVRPEVVRQDVVVVP